MTKTSVAQLALLCCRTLSSPLLRQHLLRGSWLIPQDHRDLRQSLYLSNQPWQARLPDHVFDLGFKAAQVQGLHDGKLAATALQLLAERYLLVQHGQVHVRLEHFGEWQQSVVSRVSGLPIMAAMQALHETHGGHLASLAIPRPLSERASHQLLPCVTPRDGTVEDYLSRTGLHESHLHLNGSTFAEHCWLRALTRPDREAKLFSQLWQEAKRTAAGDSVRELARQHEQEFSPAQMRRDLLLARHIRGWLVHVATKGVVPATGFPQCADDLRGLSPANLAPSLPFAFDLLRSTPAEQLRGELDWMTQLLSQPVLAPQVDRMFHLYLLLQHQYRQLMVQGEELYGFDQFQKYTFTELRTPAEKSYVQRFLDMHGPHLQRSQTAYLEGRFAPKPRAAENAELLQRILADYLAYLKYGITASSEPHGLALTRTLEELDLTCELPAVRWPQRQQLALVAHFIKKEWVPSKGGPYRYYQLRRELEAQMAQLRITLRDHPRLLRWLRGVDGAANELHAPPEVFASVFRQAERAGLSNRSFHVGEDFPHLLTGLRHMFDALVLLNLRDGARIGHGTALGIDPNLWLARMPTTLHVRCGDRLLDLLAAWQLLRELPDCLMQAYQVELELNALLPKVFATPISPKLFERAMKWRGLHMGFLASIQRRLKWNWASASLADTLREEARMVAAAKDEDSDALGVLWTWQNDNGLWKKSEALIPVETSDLLFTSELYLRLQQTLMKQIADRRVVVETLPSSNVRISQYESFDEHHAMRWMGVAGFTRPGDVPIMVSLGSDDPGIFAGNLKGEFYQLYAVLRKHGLSDSDALRHVATINERGSQYRFHDPAL